MLSQCDGMQKERPRNAFEGDSDFTGETKHGFRVELTGAFQYGIPMGEPHPMKSHLYTFLRLLECAHVSHGLIQECIHQPLAFTGCMELKHGCGLYIHGYFLPSSINYCIV